MKKYRTPPFPTSRGRSLLAIFPAPPTPKKMATFASQFSQFEWDFLCRNPYFLNAFEYDLDRAKRIASVLLKKSLIE